jgi:hypothetical protein
MTATEHTPESERAAGPEVAAGRWVRLLVWLSVVTAVVDLGVPALSGALIPPLAIGAGLTVVGLVVLRRARRAGVATLGLVHLLLVLSSAPFAAPGLAHPESPTTFLHAVIHLGGRALAVAVAVAAWRYASDAGARRLGVVALGLLGLTAVISVAAVVLTPGATAQPGDVVVTVRDFAFPAEVRVASDGHLLVENSEPMRHTFTVEGTDLSQELPERSNVRFAVDLPAGSYRLTCAVPGHETMTARLVVG